MNTPQNLSIFSLVLHASLMVQCVMALLMIVSIVSWVTMFRKYFEVKQTQIHSDQFEKEFWSGGDLNTLYQKAVNNRHNIGASGAQERIFEAGMREFLKVRATRNHISPHNPQAAELRQNDPQAALDGARRAMNAAYQREMDQLEAGLPFLASAGSVSPYVGLFGTVWGIMHAFTGLANVQQATLASVAPGIAEALVATAIGLFAAIPAVVAYNRFTSTIDRTSIRFESFIEEFSNILQRQIH
jgi:biopolymer transport protein TolQ